MLPDRVSNPGPLTYESGALPIALRGPAANSKAMAYCACSGLTGLFGYFFLSIISVFSPSLSLSGKWPDTD